jgi:DnaK suppressor protein
MDNTKLATLHSQLIARSAELEAQGQATAEDVQPVELDQACVGRLTRMDAIQRQEMAQETARRRLRQLAEIAGALRRIDSGDFGYCFACGEEIDFRRLRVDPTCTRCIGCAET